MSTDAELMTARWQTGQQRLPRYGAAVSIHLAATLGDIAPVVLMPGDPLRAQWIAETFLDEPVCYSRVRGMLGYTGTWKGQPVSVQGSGMGQPSMSIYAHELFAEYQVDTVIRVGTCGALRPELSVRDVILAQGATTDSALNRMRFPGVDYAPLADFSLLCTGAAVAAKLGISAHVGLVHSSDAFYHPQPGTNEILAAHRVLAVEMETSALYTLAAEFDRKALSVLTVSDHLLTKEQTTAAERQTSFTQMVELALDTATHTSNQ